MSADTFVLVSIILLTLYGYITIFRGWVYDDLIQDFLRSLLMAACGFVFGIGIFNILYL